MTPSTVPQAGDKDHVGEGRGSTFSSEAGTASWTNEGLSSYLVCVVEGTAENAPQGAVDIGIVAIETSTGDVLHAQFRYPDLSARCRPCCTWLLCFKTHHQ